MGGKSPRWEHKLWSYLASGDGEHCPFRSICHIWERDVLCPDDNRKRIAQLEDSGQFKLSNYGFIKHGICSGIFIMVEMLAQEILKEGRVRCPPVPIKLVSLVDEQHPIEIHLLPLKTYHGAIWRLRDRWVIQLKYDDKPSIRRFTIFHEAFHIIAHCKTTPVFRKRGTRGGSFNELLATHFAACILMPRKWVKEKWAEVNDLSKMAQIFAVPQSAMCIRLKRLGLL